MKMKTLVFAAGVSAPLILGGSAPAAFTGITTVSKPNEFGLFVCNVYAEFDDTADTIMGVSGTPNAPISITVTGGTFFQHAFGGDLAPPQALVDVFPDLAVDTFVTVGVKTNEGVDETFIGPGWPGFGADTLLVDNNYWWVPQGAPQGVPDASGQILIGQFSTLDGNAIGGTFQVSWFDAQRTAFNDVVEFSHPVAPPCPWDCGNDDGIVGIVDMLNLLTQWGQEGGSCDFNNHPIGIIEFLELLANWGACP